MFGGLRPISRVRERTPGLCGLWPPSGKAARSVGVSKTGKRVAGSGRRTRARPEHRAGALG